MTKAALDSAYAPSDAQIAAAKAAGYIAWFGYFKLFTNDGIYNGWADSDFERVLAGGLQTGAYCSGWDDPLAVKARAGRLGIRTRLDVEGGIRPDGPWVQGWLDTSDSGLYGNWPVMTGRRAIDYVVAAYPISGDPGGEAWPSWLTRPTGGPCGWQWAGSHSFAGITVDSTWLDDGFFAFGVAGDSLGEVDVTPAQEQKLDNAIQGIINCYAGIQNVFGVLTGAAAPSLGPYAGVNISGQVAELKAALNNLKIIGGGLTPDQDAALQAAEKAATAVEAQLVAGLKLDIPLGAIDIKGSVKA